MAESQAVDDGDRLRLLRNGGLINAVVQLLALSILPTGAFGFVAHSHGSLVEKLDQVISRLDKLEGSGVSEKVKDLDERMRRVEEDVVRLRVLIEKK